VHIKALFSVALLAASIAFGQSTDIDSIRKAAEQGDSSAQFKLGHAYDFGDGVAKDHDQAIVWYQKAALARIIHEV
jgi:TPR repeat protein